MAVNLQPTRGWASLLLCAGLFVAASGVARAGDLETRAERGDPGAMFELATNYDLGERGPQNPELAFKWYRRAGEAGLPNAEFNVAVMLDSGRGATQNLAEAAAWYGRAAARGNHRAQYNLALLYDTGDGVPHNAALAAFWLRLAAPSIPAATRRITALRPEDRTTALSAAILVVPHGDVAVGKAPLEFVWTAAAQAEPVRFLIEVRALGRIASTEAFSTFTEGSALAVPLRGQTGEYAWRVFTIARVAARYAVSEWTAFTVSQQPSMTSRRE